MPVVGGGVDETIDVTVLEDFPEVLYEFCSFALSFFYCLSCAGEAPVFVSER